MPSQKLSFTSNQSPPPPAIFQAYLKATFQATTKAFL
jgi:hypothetical protein